MRIAYLNPWTNAAESQAYFSLAAAASSLGIDLVSCNTAEDVDTSHADFVLSVASSVPKTADLPTYLTVHEPAKRFLDHAFYMNNLLSYDGYLTISENLEKFATDVCFASGRAVDVGFYYNTPQISSFTTDFETVASTNALRIVYIGTNWDKRAPGLLTQLDKRGTLRIHGPEHGWSQHSYAGYEGPLPFDGAAPQRAYSEAGIGLVLLSADHMREDIISNRIFEITSVGAIAVCPDIPWIRRWFGDSVLYFTPSQAADSVAAEISRHYESVRDDPAAAAGRGLQAREIFEKTFAAEHMLLNAVAYHESVQREHTKRLRTLEPAPQISVVVRCGNRRASQLKQAIDSIRAQSLGVFTVILAAYEEVDLAVITRDLSGAIWKFVEVDGSGRTRGATLAAGLRAIDTEYFAILDDDDYWMSDHVESLFSSAALADPDFDVSFSGTVCVAAESTQIETSLRWSRNICNFGFDRAPTLVSDVTGAFASNCFIARSSLLPPNLESICSIETAEDSVIVACVVRRKRPVFSFKPTAFFRRGYSGESEFAKSETRKLDLRSFDLLTGLLFRPTWLADEPLAARRAAPNLEAFVRYLIGDCVVIARIVVAAVTRRDHPSARRELLVSPLRALRRAS